MVVLLRCTPSVVEQYQFNKYNAVQNHNMLTHCYDVIKI